MKRSIHGIKQVMASQKPLIMMSAPPHAFSLIKPVGGASLTHFGQVLIKIKEEERYREYILIQHPFLLEKTVRYYFPRQPKRKLSNVNQFKRIDSFF